MNKKCRECGIEKVCVWSGRFNSSGRKIYINEKKHWWNGRQCPDCKYSKPFIKKSDLAEIGPERPLETPHAYRKCLICNEGLLVNKFFHPSCQPHCPGSLFEVYGMTDYGW